MNINHTLLFTYLFILIRTSAVLLSSPLFGTVVPMQIRIGVSMVISAALLPVLEPSIGAIPEDLHFLVLRVLNELAVGLIIGTFIQFLMLSAQMAGAIVDLQMGLGSIQILNPLTNTPVSLLAQFKYILTVVLFIIVGGHHYLFDALVKSYSFHSIFTLETLSALKEYAPRFITDTMLLALQIAAPVAGVCLIVDIAAGIVNKSVPQMQVYLVAMPAKISVGILSLALSLPVLLSCVQGGLEKSWNLIEKILTGGRI